MLWPPTFQYFPEPCDNKKMHSFAPQRKFRRRLIAQIILPASKSSGDPMYCQIEDSVANIGDGPYGANGMLVLKRVAPNPSLLASHYTRKGREPCSTAFKSGKPRTGGAASSASMSRTMASMVGANKHSPPSSSPGPVERRALRACHARWLPWSVRTNNRRHS